MSIEQATGDDLRKSVRPATLKDAADIAYIHETVFHALFGASHPLVPSYEQLHAQWEQTLTQEAPDGCYTLVAIHGFRIVGFASCVPAQEIHENTVGTGKHLSIPQGTEIVNLWVERAFQRSGHGSRLLAALVDVTQAKALRVWVNADDESYIRFLRSAGFGPAGIRRAFSVNDSGDQQFVEHLWWALNT
ncbi:GNAT family N-acetyltransferase [Schaalia sp. lx-260]|uniref:GNAT family N-acetyltransferase n=1 Tax=Schaalia sp. lx-260 TaxID=2899082 RepID=UPI001E524ED9|nr:GNAT family N-acetyltransferase [Schaalia sp. lx-260]MCD4549391.1 GNAT family N-acetyltransferase [Schaalia sp. lx-260]